MKTSTRPGSCLPQSPVRDREDVEDKERWEIKYSGFIISEISSDVTRRRCEAGRESVR